MTIERASAEGPLSRWQGTDQHQRAHYVISARPARQRWVRKVADKSEVRSSGSRFSGDETSDTVVL
jgi:hypothetical protein